jgi:hypothetical protein
MALRKATDPNSGDVALAYCYAYEATWPKIQAWMAAHNCTTPISQGPGLNTTTSPSPGTDTTAGTIKFRFIAGRFIPGRWNLFR